jgi:hypothetical protein
MSFADDAALSMDPEFAARVVACIQQQAMIFIDDARPEYKNPAMDVIAVPMNAGTWVPLVAAMPGMKTTSTDGDILSAVQAVWPKRGAATL